MSTNIRKRKCRRNTCRLVIYEESDPQKYFGEVKNNE